MCSFMGASLENEMAPRLASDSVFVSRTSAQRPNSAPEVADWHAMVSAQPNASVDGLKICAVGDR